MKDNLPYFSHDNNARRHPKMKALIAEFGYEGYGRFWALNERIAESSNAYIDISRKVNRLDLANELGLDGDSLDTFLAFLSDPEIDLINLQDGKITTDRISEIFSKTMGNRENERVRKTGKIGKDEIPPGKEDFPASFRPENDTDKTRQDNTKQDNTKQDNTKQDSGGSNEPPLSESEKQAFELSELLLSSHRKEFPDYLSGKKDHETISRWTVDIGKLIRIDKKQPENIRQVILWVKTPGNFWFPNIESGKKLREKFDRLWGQMHTKSGKSGNDPPERISFIPDVKETELLLKEYEQKKKNTICGISLVEEFNKNMRINREGDYIRSKECMEAESYGGYHK